MLEALVNAVQIRASHGYFPPLSSSGTPVPEEPISNSLPYCGESNTFSGVLCSVVSVRRGLARRFLPGILDFRV